MAERISSSALNRASGDLITRASMGETFELTRHGRVIAVLGPPQGNVAPEPKRVRTKPTANSSANHGLDANLDETLATPITAQTVTFGASSGSSSVAGPMQVEVTDASHPSRRPVQSSDPLTAQQQRDQILNNLGGKKNR